MYQKCAYIYIYTIHIVYVTWTKKHTVDASKFRFEGCGSIYWSHVGFTSNFIHSVCSIMSLDNSMGVARLPVREKLNKLHHGSDIIIIKVEYEVIMKTPSKKVAQRVCEIDSTSSIPGQFSPNLWQTLGIVHQQGIQGNAIRQDDIPQDGHSFDGRDEEWIVVFHSTLHILYYFPYPFETYTPLFIPTSTRQWSHSHGFPPCFVPGSPTGRYCLGWWGDPWKREACPSRWTWCSSCAHSWTCPHLSRGWRWQQQTKPASSASYRNCH